MIYALVVTMYTTSGTQNMQYQWTKTITHIGAPSYTNIQTFRIFSGSTLTRISGNTLGYKAFLCIKWSHILFSLTTCNLTCLENQTPSGQSYTLISLCPFSAGLLETLQSMTKTVAAQVKALNKLLSGRAVWSSNIDDKGSDEHLGDEI